MSRKTRHNTQGKKSFKINTLCCGGQRGIRTLETVPRLHTFQACAFDHSATCPAAATYRDSSWACKGAQAKLWRPPGAAGGRYARRIARSCARDVSTQRVKRLMEARRMLSRRGVDAPARPTATRSLAVSRQNRTAPKRRPAGAEGRGARDHGAQAGRIRAGPAAPCKAPSTTALAP